MLLSQCSHYFLQKYINLQVYCDLKNIWEWLYVFIDKIQLLWSISTLCTNKNRLNPKLFITEQIFLLLRIKISFLTFYNVWYLKNSKIQQKGISSEGLINEVVCPWRSTTASVKSRRIRIIPINQKKNQICTAFLYRLCQLWGFQKWKDIQTVKHEKSSVNRAPNCVCRSITIFFLKLIKNLTIYEFIVGCFIMTDSFYELQNDILIFDTGRFRFA